MAIAVIALSSMAATSRGADHLLTGEPDAFSAVTVFAGSKRTIVHNDGHSNGRISRGRLAKPGAAAHFGVSEKMIQYRVNITGAVVRVERARKAAYRSR